MSGVGVNQFSALAEPFVDAAGLLATGGMAVLRPWASGSSDHLDLAGTDQPVGGDGVLFGGHVADLNASNNVPVRSYICGLNLSETLEGAGDVGRLLWGTLHTNSGPTAGSHFCAYDGNCNMVVLAAALDASATARYEYGPFGEPIRLTGSAEALNPFRFSAKQTENTTDLIFYEYGA